MEPVHSQLVGAPSATQPQRRCRRQGYARCNCQADRSLTFASGRVKTAVVREYKHQYIWRVLDVRFAAIILLVGFVAHAQGSKAVQSETEFNTVMMQSTFRIFGPAEDPSVKS